MKPEEQFSDKEAAEFFLIRWPTPWIFKPDYHPDQNAGDIKDAAGRTVFPHVGAEGARGLIAIVNAYQREKE